MYSIRTKMIVVVLVAMTLISLLLSWIALDAATDTAFNNVTQSIRDLSAEGAELVSARLETQYAYLLGLGKIARLHRPEEDLSVKNRILHEEKGRRPFLRIGFATPWGVVHFTDDMNREYSLDIGDQAFFQQSMKGQPWAVPPNPSFDPRDQGEMVMVYSVPLTYEGEVTGVLVAVGEWDMLTRLIEDIGNGEKGYAYIMDSHCTCIAHQRRELVLSQYNPIEDAKENETIVPLAQLFQDVIEKGVSDGAYFFNERMVYASFTPIGNTPWVLSVAALESEMMASVVSLRRKMTLAAMGMLFLGSVMALFIGNYFTKPVIQMEKLFTKAAKGDLAVRATIKSRDEIGRASRSFNTMMNHINELTYYDPVTHLPNARVLAEAFHQHISGQQKEGLLVKPITLTLMAADGFSRINETYGYDQGNQLLHMAAQRLQQMADHDSRVFRGHSDEVLVLRTNSEEWNEELKRVEKWLGHLMEPYDTQAGVLNLTFSAGMARYPEHGNTVEELLQKAGLAKTLAKTQGRGQVKAFSAEVGREVLEATELEHALSQALSQNQLKLVYQPIVDLHSQKVKGVEALLRWQHPEKGNIPPDVFIPLAERSGLIHGIGQWVLKEACRQQVTWQRKHSVQWFMAVNIAASQFESPDFVAMVEKTLRQTGMDPRLLELEMTERTVIQEVEGSIRRLNVLRQMGVGISMDDFGTGYSSLSYMVRLPVDTLKIDRSFISSMSESRQAQAIASTIIAMGHSLNLKMIAEGIETKEQRDLLQKGACQMGQGYLFSRPLSAEQMAPLLEQSNQAIDR